MSETGNAVTPLPSPRYFGKYRGIVFDNKDPKQLGRLQIRVPTIHGKDTSKHTDWAWPCVPYGGLNQGTFFVPPKEARVWVEFAEGNLDEPIWVGASWAAPGGTSEIPEDAKAMDENDPQRRVIRTESGHVLEFSDVEGKESIRIAHKDGSAVTLDEKGNVIISNTEGSFIYLNAADGEMTMVDQKGNTIAMRDKGTMIMNKDGTFIDLAADGVSVSATHVHIRSDTVSLGEGALEPAILGTAFAAVFDAHVHPTALGPSGPPVPVPMPLSSPLHPAISKAVKVK